MNFRNEQRRSVQVDIDADHNQGKRRWISSKKQQKKRKEPVWFCKVVLSCVAVLFQPEVDTPSEPGEPPDDNNACPSIWGMQRLAPGHNPRRTPLGEQSSHHSPPAFCGVAGLMVNKLSGSRSAFNVAFTSLPSLPRWIGWKRSSRWHTPQKYHKPTFGLLVYLLLLVCVVCLTEYYIKKAPDFIHYPFAFLKRESSWAGLHHALPSTSLGGCEILFKDVKHRILRMLFEFSGVMLLFSHSPVLWMCSFILHNILFILYSYYLHFTLRMFT